MEVKATTPFFIRGTDPDKPDDFFRLPDGRLAIPGTSLKGVIRTVVETISFGKLGAFDDRKFPVRDLSHAGYRDKVTKGDPRNGYEALAQAAWLCPTRDGWRLVKCDFYGRIEQEDLEAAQPGLDLGTAQDAPKKYEAFTGSLDDTWLVENQTNLHRAHTQPLRYRKAAPAGERLPNPASLKQGRLVFTGQPSDRKPEGITNQRGDRISRGKHMEFIFFPGPPAATENVGIKLHDNVYSLLEKTHSGDAATTLHWWLERGTPIPVFYTLTTGKDGKTGIGTIGLAQMHRVLSTLGVKDALPPAHRAASGRDLAELIFGYVGGRNALRGRANFTTLCGPIPANDIPTVETVLGSPRPTFYPNYLQQPDAGPDGVLKKAPDQWGNLVSANHKTWLDAKDITLRGRKYYPAVPDAPDGTIPQWFLDLPAPPSPDVAVTFTPVPAGTTFSGELHFHNLSAVELGALVWALTFGDATRIVPGPEVDWRRHSIHRHRAGMAKPLGFGNLLIRIAGCELAHCLASPKLAQCVAAFEQWLGDTLPQPLKPWKNTPPIRELLAMSDSSIALPDDQYRYPVLNPEKKTDEFRKARGDRWHKDSLPPYSQIAAQLRQRR